LIHKIFINFVLFGHIHAAVIFEVVSLTILGIGGYLFGELLEVFGRAVFVLGNFDGVDAGQPDGRRLL
jgi:hypothetical protein